MCVERDVFLCACACACACAGACAGACVRVLPAVVCRGCPFTAGKINHGELADFDGGLRSRIGVALFYYYLDDTRYTEQQHNTIF